MSDKQSKVTDPVCGMSIDPATAAGSSTHEGRTFYFCSAACKAKFDADPHHYDHPSDDDGRPRA
jgi:Cu+-exporting ATPase